jgi:DNA-binding transcriptional ArsR family regulator
MTMSPANRSDQTHLLRALRHPLRRRILRRLADGENASPRELSAALDQSLSNVSYHVRVLVDCAAVTLVNARPARGSVEHFYRSTVDAPWALQVLGLGESDRGGAGENSDGAST